MQQGCKKDAEKARQAQVGGPLISVEFWQGVGHVGRYASKCVSVRGCVNTNGKELDGDRDGRRQNNGKWAWEGNERKRRAEDEP